MNIILIGYRGTGKTSVGKLLAVKLGGPFLDSDEMIRASLGKSVREIVAGEGWSSFRREEKRIIAGLSQNDGCVIALGGGAVLDEENVRNLKGKGLFIWLMAEAQIIAGRLNGDGKNREQRPSLTGKDPDEEIKFSLKERAPLYARIADCRVETSGRSIEEVAEEVFGILGETVQAYPGRGKRHGG